MPQRKVEMQTLGSQPRLISPTRLEMEVSNHFSNLGIQARRVLANEGSPLRKRCRRERTKEKVHSSDRWGVGEGEPSNQCYAAGAQGPSTQKESGKGDSI